MTITEKADSCPVLLLLRFSDRAFSATIIEMGGRILQEEQFRNAFHKDGLSTFEECIASLIDHFGLRNSEIHLDHRASIKHSSDQVLIANLSEIITRSEKFEGGVCYRLEIKGLADGVASTEDPIESLYDLKNSGFEVRCCGTCENAILPMYGGADPRHGLYCCRNNLGVALEKNIEGTLEDFDDCLSRVSCFHLCEQYKHRTGPI